MFRFFGYLFLLAFIGAIFLPEVETSTTAFPKAIQPPDETPAIAVALKPSPKTVQKVRLTTAPTNSPAKTLDNPITVLTPLVPKTKADVTVIKPNTHYVTGSRVNFRSGPSTKWAVQGQLALGDRVDVIRKTNDWSQIRITSKGAQTFWMSSKYLDENELENRAITNVAAPRAATPKRSVAVPNSAEVSRAIKKMIAQSVTQYSGSCPCPYNRDRGGRRCGKRSAWSKPGGASPICYESDVSRSRLTSYFARQGKVYK